MILIVLNSSGLVPDSVFRTGEILPEFRVPDSGPDLRVPHKPGSCFLSAVRFYPETGELKSGVAESGVCFLKSRNRSNSSSRALWDDELLSEHDSRIPN